MIDFVKKNFPILIIILILGSYLGIKALSPDSWDGWAFPSSQVLMSNQFWIQDGFFEHYFLMLAKPSPYSKLVKYLDFPEFRNRPVDTLSGELPRLRLYYTHYPPLYMMPYAILMKIGLDVRALLRIFSLLISLSGLIIFYWFVKSFSDKLTATIASIYYGFSVMFLNFADSIQTPPWTMLFMFLIMTLRVLAQRNCNNQKIYSRYNLIIWLAYFILSLLSYDATFFIFAYLVLFDILIQKKYQWQRWLFFSSAPILGFGLQIVQNVWYLGWHDMVNDLFRAYKERQIGTIKNFILGVITPFVSMTGIKTLYFFKKTLVTLGSAFVIVGILWKSRSKLNLNHNFFRIIFVLAGAAIFQPFLINITGWWPYQGVLTASFWGLLIGASSLSVIRIVKQKKYLITREKIMFFILGIITLALWTYQLSNTWNYVKDWPNNKPDQKIIEFSKTIKKFYPGEEKIAFRIYPKNPLWKSQFPTFNFEYYLGMLKIDLANKKDLLADFWWLRNISEYPFYSFIITESKNDSENIRQELINKNIKNISSIMNVQGQYVFIVDPK